MDLQATPWREISDSFQTVFQRGEQHMAVSINRCWVGLAFKSSSLTHITQTLVFDVIPVTKRYLEAVTMIYHDHFLMLRLFLHMLGGGGGGQNQSPPFLPPPLVAATSAPVVQTAPYTQPPTSSPCGMANLGE